jgi:hypothetical protein
MTELRPNTPKVPKSNPRSPNRNIQWAIDLIGFPWENQWKHQINSLGLDFSLNFPLYLLLYSLGYFVLGFVAYGFVAIGAKQFSIGLMLFLILGSSICGAIPDLRGYIVLISLIILSFPYMAFATPGPLSLGSSIVLVILFVLLLTWSFVVTLGKESWKLNNLFMKEILVRSLLALPGIFSGLGIAMLLTILRR